MTDELDTTLTLRLPEELKSRLAAATKKNWLKPSDLARIAIRNYLVSECGTTELQHENKESK